MIETDTGCIDVCRIGPGTDELCKAIPEVHSIGHWKSIQYLLKGGGRIRSQAGIGNVSHIRSLRLRQTKSFVRKEKERSVLAVVNARNLNRSTQRPSKVVLPFRWFRLAKVVVEPV